MTTFTILSAYFITIDTAMPLGKKQENNVFSVLTSQSETRDERRVWPPKVAFYLRAWLRIMSTVINE